VSYASLRQTLKGVGELKAWGIDGVVFLRRAAADLPSVFRAFRFTSGTVRLYNTMSSEASDK